MLTYSSKLQGRFDANTIYSWIFVGVVVFHFTFPLHITLPIEKSDLEMSEINNKVVYVPISSTTKPNSLKILLAILNLYVSS